MLVWRCGNPLSRWKSAVPSEVGGEDCGEIDMKATKTGLTLTAAVLLLVPMLLAGCDATAGAGRDITSAGQAITNSANENKTY